MVTKVKIIICDDDLSFQVSFSKQVAKVLKNKGYHVEVFLYSNPQELLADSLEDIDVYFLDIDMPELNGIEAADLLRMGGMLNLFL